MIKDALVGVPAHEDTPKSKTAGINRFPLFFYSSRCYAATVDI